MSLVKLAFNPLAIIPASLAAFGFQAARSGNPLKFVTTKDVKSLFGVRKKLQKAAISTAGQSLARIKKGYVQDSTRAIPAIIDAQLGHPFRMGIAAAEAGYHSKGLKGKVIRHIIDTSIDDTGRFKKAVQSPLGKKLGLKFKDDEFAIERFMRVGNKLNKVLDRKNQKIYGSVIGGGIGALHGANRKDQKSHRLKSTLAGGIKGAITGGSIGFGASELGKVTRLARDMHKEFHADPYMREMLESANGKGLSGKIYRGLGHLGSRMYTTTPNKRAIRMAASEARSEFNQNAFTSGPGIKKLSIKPQKDFIERFTNATRGTKQAITPFNEKSLERTYGKLNRDNMHDLKIKPLVSKPKFDYGTVFKNIPKEHWNKHPIHKKVLKHFSSPEDYHKITGE